LKELKEVSQIEGHLIDFSYKDFANELSGERVFAEKKYYIGAVRADQGDSVAQKLRRNQ